MAGSEICNELSAVLDDTMFGVSFEEPEGYNATESSTAGCQIGAGSTETSYGSNTNSIRLDAASADSGAAMTLDEIYGYWAGETCATPETLEENDEGWHVRGVLCVDDGTSGLHNPGTINSIVQADNGTDLLILNYTNASNTGTYDLAKAQSLLAALR